MKKFLVVLLVLLTLTGFASASSDADPSVVPCPGDPPLIIGGGWQYFNGPGLGWADEEFTFQNCCPVCLYVTDIYLNGTVFEIYDNGVLIGSTSWVPVGSETTLDPDLAYASETWSSGEFTIPAGNHVITIKCIQEVSGRFTACIKAECGPCPPPPVPEFPALGIPVVFVGGFLLIVGALRREH